jgi:origin recognition complex subunit 3
VTEFVKEASSHTGSAQIPSAFIITGANIASQGLLFEQLSDRLEEHAEAKVVRLRSDDASNLKAALKKIIQAVTAEAPDRDDEQEAVVSKDVRRSYHGAWFWL